jgi:hypothetical protein
MTLSTDTAITAGEWKPPTKRAPLNLTEDTLLTRAEVAAALTDAGYPVASGTLQTKATRGDGPPFMHFGPRVLYRWGTSLEWAKSRLTRPVRNTSEATAA